MFERWDTSQVVMFAIGSALNQLSEFIDVFGMRFVGLIDQSGVYQDYRVPNPEAPYPQDYIVDQDGIVRYWSDQYDAQAVIQTVDRLLATGVAEPPCVIEVEVSDDDVGHVLGVEAERLHLPQRRLPLLAHRPHQGPEGPPQPVRKDFHLESC